MSMRRGAGTFGIAIALLALLGCSISGMADRMTGEDVNRKVREHGLPARATVLEIWDTGVKVNDDPVVGFRLEVHAEGRPSWVGETKALVSLLDIPRVQPGVTLAVRYDPGDPSRVALAGEEEPPSEATTDNKAPAGPVRIGDDLIVEPIADGVWLHTSYHHLEGFGNTAANGLLVESGHEAALVDTPWTNDQTRRLISWAAESQHASVSTVVVTHSHQDCSGGLHAAHRAGARSYGLARTAELAEARGTEPPQVRFTERLDIQLAGRSLELRFVGPGHTEDTIVVWLPDVEVLFGGCLVRSAAATTLGYTAEADLARWPATIEALQKRYGHARLIVPGHGRPGGVALLAHTLDLLRNR